MQPLEAFSDVETSIIVYCRAARLKSSAENRWITWRQVAYEDLFGYPRRFSVQAYARAWDQRITRRGGLTFVRFRERIRQIAAESLSYLPGVIVVHDFQTLLTLTRSVKNFLVIPVDDDDWYCPDIADRLSRIRVQAGKQLVAWPDLVWWCDFKQNSLAERFGVQEPSDVARAVGSNTYAVTPRAFSELNRETLKTVLDCHWKLISLVPADKIQRLQQSLSLEVKHIGCTSVLLQQDGNGYWWNKDVDEYEAPLWAREHCDKVRELHLELLSDMGGIFDSQTILREIEQPN